MDKKETHKDDAAEREAKDAAEIPKQAPASEKEEQAPENEGEKKLAETTDRLLRLTAEFDNYKKRTAKEKEQLAIHAEGKLMLKLLPIYEEISLAEKEAAKVKEAGTREGVLMVLAKLRTAFGKEGLQEMKLDGEKFDPYRHEVALREESDAPEGEIVRVIQKGYLFKGEVLRHAIVSVSSGKTTKNDAGKDEKTEKKEE